MSAGSRTQSQANQSPIADGAGATRPVQGGEKVCSGCGKSAVDAGVEKLLKCSVCTIAPSYCSAACQKACWKAHKTECKANRKPES